MIAPYNSSSSVNAGIDGALKPEWTSACLVTNATKVQRGGWFEWLRISGARFLSLALIGASHRTTTRRFRKIFLLTSDPRHRWRCSFSSTCSVCSSRGSKRVLRACVRQGTILNPNILFLATRRARAFL